MYKRPARLGGYLQRVEFPNYPTGSITTAWNKLSVVEELETTGFKKWLYQE